VVIHSKAGAAVLIGENSSIAHRSIIHGPCEIGHHVFVGFNSVLFNCKIGAHSAIRHNAVVDGRDLPAYFYVPAMSYINPRTDLSQYPPIDISISEFSESVVSTNIELVKGYKALHNEF
jgi:carbonic anhydrase/acetyltransferase-like protein (isoleucine patch superfamily)